MLYKNDELYKLTMADHGAIKKRFQKFPIRLVYPANRIKPSPSKHNKLPDKPTSISFPLVATVKTNTGTEQWRYAENKIIGEHGKVVWTPHNLVLRGAITLTKSDSELIWWLWKACPVLEGGDNFNGKQAKCAFEDLIGSAEKKAIKEEQIATVKALIYSSRIGLGEEKLRRVAKAYFISGVDDMTLPQVKLLVDNHIQRDRQNGIKNFIELTEGEIELNTRSTIQQAIDENTIRFHEPTKQWAWVMDYGNKVEPFVKIVPGADRNEALYTYYKNNRQFAEDLDAALKGAKVVNKKKK